MDEKKLSKKEVYQLILKINFIMIVIAAFAMYWPLIINFACKETENADIAIIAMGNSLLMPSILLCVSLVVRIIYAYKKSLAEQVRKIYMWIPVFYMFITFPATFGIVCIIDKFIK